MEKLLEKSARFLGFLEASLLVLYVLLISTFMNFLSGFFQKEPSLFAPVLFLIMFVFSAVTAGLVVLGIPGYFFWDRKYRKAAEILGWFLVFLTLYFLVVLAVFIFGQVL